MRVPTYSAAVSIALTMQRGLARSFRLGAARYLDRCWWVLVVDVLVDDLREWPVVFVVLRAIRSHLSGPLGA